MNKISLNKILSNASFIALLQCVTFSGFYLNIVNEINNVSLVAKKTGTFFVLFLIFFIYFMKKSLLPVFKFIKEKNAVSIDVALKSYSNIFKKSIIISTLFIILNSFYSLYFLNSNMLTELVNIVFFSYYFNFLFYINMESMGYFGLSEKLYSEKDLYSKKKGFSLSINTKFYFIIINFLIIPYCIILSYLMKTNDILVFLPFFIVLLSFILFLIKKISISHKLGAIILVVFSVIMYNTTIINANFFSIYSVIIVSILFAALSFTSIYKSINSPLIELKDKMIRLSKGDFDVKSRVYTDDEIGTMKVNFNTMIDGLREREYVKDTLGKVVSYEVAKKMIENKGLELGGDLVNGTVLFSDIRGFTELSEKMDAQNIVNLLNKYFTNITHPVLKNKGIVNKFIGDAILAVFLTEFGSENTSEDALRSAFGMIEALKDFNENNLDFPDIKFGIGIHTGNLVAGNIGSDERMEYTVIGDTVNVASRIESETKKQNSTVLISKNVYNDLSNKCKDEFIFEEINNIKVKGREQSLTLYIVSQRL